MGLSKDTEKIFYASTEIAELTFRARVNGATGAGCILGDIQEDGDEAVMAALGDIQNIMLSYDDGEGSLEAVTFDVVNSPITAPHGWLQNVPENAREFGYITSKGLIRRYCLILFSFAVLQFHYYLKCFPVFCDYHSITQYFPSAKCCYFSF